MHIQIIYFIKISSIISKVLLVGHRNFPLLYLTFVFNNRLLSISKKCNQKVRLRVPRGGSCLQIPKQLLQNIFQWCCRTNSTGVFVNCFCVSKDIIFPQYKLNEKNVPIVCILCQVQSKSLWCLLLRNW